MTFEISKTTTWGITQDNRNSDFVSVPVVINDPKMLEQIERLFDVNNAKNPLYGNKPDYKTLYLRLPKYALGEKLKEDLYNKGRQQISINFEFTNLYKTKHMNYLNFKITKLCKFEKKTKEVIDNCTSDFCGTNGYKCNSCS